MFSLAQQIEITGSIVGFIIVFIMTISPQIFYKVRMRKKNRIHTTHRSYFRGWAYLLLGCAFGVFIGLIVGFIAGGYLGRNDPHMLYGPLIGAMYGSVGGGIGGLIGSSINIQK